MAGPATEGLRELERELMLATEVDETRSFPELQERFGLGHDDLAASLDMLRTHGKAIEDAPGEWRGPHQDEIDRAIAQNAGAEHAAGLEAARAAAFGEAGRVQVSGDMPDEYAFGGDPPPVPGGPTVTEDMNDAVRQWLRYRDGQRPGAAQIGPGQLPASPHVRLTRAIAEALGPEALGKLVQAGIAEAPGTFVLEVL